MKKTIPFLLLTMGSNLTYGAQVNEYFLCTPTHVKAMYFSDSTLKQTTEHDCTIKNNNTMCKTPLKIHKHLLTASLTDYYSERKNDIGLTPYQLSINRATGNFEQYNNATTYTHRKGSEGWITTTKGTCTLHQEKLKY